MFHRFGHPNITIYFYANERVQRDVFAKRYPKLHIKFSSDRPIFIHLQNCQLYKKLLTYKLNVKSPTVA